MQLKSVVHCILFGRSQLAGCMYCQVYRHYWSQRGFPIPGNIQKEDCDLLRFTPTVRFVADMHAISSLAGDDGANSICCESQVFFIFYFWGGRPS